MSSNSDSSREVILYERVDTPTYCYVTEAIHWIALARIPEPLLSEIRTSDGSVEFIDDRWNPDVFRAGDLASVGWAGFYEREFRALSIDIDYEDYHDALMECGPFDADTARQLALSASRDEEKAERARESAARVRALEEPFLQLLDRAWASLFEAIASGKLPARGWKTSTTKEQAERHGGYEGELVDIPANRWSLRNFNLEATFLKGSGFTYYGVQVPFRTLTELFPRPLIGHSHIAGAEAAGVFIADAGEAIAAQSPLNKRPRGRPPLRDGAVQLAAVNIFADRIRKGDVPDKREALVQEVIDWVSLAFHTPISRGTAQKYLKEAERAAKKSRQEMKPRARN